MMNWHFAPSLLAAIGSFAFVQVLPAGSIGPVGVYYATDNSSGTIYAIQGNSVAQTAEVDTPYEGPIAVLPNGTVATTGYFSPRPNVTGEGATYTGVPSLILTPSGSTAAQQLSVAYDGTTDGTRNFAVDHNTGGVFSFGLDWSDSHLIFTTSADESVIAYDSANNSLWIQNEGSLTLTDYTLAGAVVSSFTPAATGYEGLALAMDVDGTLWFSDYGTNTLEHYATDGTNLGSFTFTNLDGTTTQGSPFFLGAEIGGSAVPEPGTMLLLALPIVALSWHRLSRATRERPALDLPVLP